MKLGACFSSRLEFSDGALEDGDLRDGIAGGFQFGADLFFEVGGVSDAVDQKVEKPFDRDEALGLEFFYGLIGDGHVAAPHVEHHIVVAVLPDALES